MKMENERLCIEISEHGAEVTRIYDKKKETELLWEGNPTYWKRHSPILFPNVGKTYKNKVKIIFGETIVYLFGSRIDDSKKGGDIDLYIISKVNEDLFKKKIKLKTILEDLLFKPVDIIIAKDENRLIEKEARKGIRIL